VEDRTLVDLKIERREFPTLVGSIYKGKVVRVLPGMQAAFVDVGLNRAAFLYVGDIRDDIVRGGEYFFEREEDEPRDDASPVSEPKPEDIVDQTKPQIQDLIKV